MFGKARDLELLLENTADGVLPDDVRQGLESLHYFRSHYGGAPLDETGRKKVTLMDSAWAMAFLLPSMPRTSFAPPSLAAASAKPPV